MDFFPTPALTNFLYESLTKLRYTLPVFYIGILAASYDPEGTLNGLFHIANCTLLFILCSPSILTKLNTWIFLSSLFSTVYIASDKRTVNLEMAIDSPTFNIIFELSTAWLFYFSTMGITSATFIRLIFEYLFSTTLADLLPSKCQNKIKDLSRVVFEDLTIVKYHGTIENIKEKSCAHNMCSICLEDFQKDDDLRLVPSCQHTFHSHCIKKWLDESLSCPYCRATLNNPTENEEEIDNIEDSRTLYERILSQDLSSARVRNNVPIMFYY